MSVIVKLLSKFDDSGIKKAKKSFSGLSKGIGALGLGIGLKQVTDLLIDSAKAASADAKSQELLSAVLKRSAGATKEQIKGNENFIQTLSNQVGIVDDDLRPAMANLARTTGSTKKAQELLALAVDASALKHKPLLKVSEAVSKAYLGQTGQLIRLFPELKKSKDLMGDFANTVKGFGAQQADPFAKLNVGMDNLKEKLGAKVLPYVVDFIDTMMKPGGAIDQVGQFLDDVSNPKTEAGKTFLDIKTAIEATVGGVKDFFALFGNGDAMKGFANIATALIRALPALLALKGIMMLAAGGKAIASLVTAINLITGASAANAAATTGTTVATTAAATGVVASSAILAAAGAGAVAGALINTQITEDIKKKTGKTFLINAGGMDVQGMSNFLGFNRPNNVTINVQGTDPKAVVDALSKYVKQNGNLPSNLYAMRRGR